jgi:hypothetical protein
MKKMASNIRLPLGRSVGLPSPRRHWDLIRYSYTSYSLRMEND